MDQGLGAEIMERLEAASKHSEGGAGVTRTFLTQEHRAVAELFLGWMAEAGMTAQIDDAGNVVGRYEGAEPGLPSVMTGSHQDSVRHGGKYDGMLGAVLPISCVRRLHQEGVRLPFAIEVAAFGDEEGVRFPGSMLGSHALAGSYDPSVLTSMGADGLRLDEALTNFGLNPENIPALARKPGDLLAFVEVHIEQGPVLEAEGLPVGVVTGIAGCERLSAAFRGMAGHAGTTPMTLRRDAAAAAAEAVLAVERLCSGQEGLVGTVGILEAFPGSANVIPGEARFSLDIRAPDRDLRLATLEKVTAALNEIAARRGIELELAHDFTLEGCASDGRIMERLEAAVAAEGIRPFRLFSGAGHDAMVMAGIAPMGMLFVRCEKGISHNPLEAITVEDADTAARVFLNFLRSFDGA